MWGEKNVYWNGYNGSEDEVIDEFMEALYNVLTDEIKKKNFLQ